MLVGLLKINLFRNKSYGVNYAQGTTDNFFSRDSNCIADVVMRPKFHNSIISMEVVIITSIS